MKNLLVLAVGSVPLWVSVAASAQVGPMMNRRMGDVGWMGGYGGYWLPVVPVLLLVIVGLVAWIVTQKRK